MKRIAAILLLILGAYMIHLSMLGEAIARPPMVSGIAFIIIGGVWLSNKSYRQNFDFRSKKKAH
jgi:membrane-bound ClpP family serine protease